jgi:hypothetical protein
MAANVAGYRAQGYRKYQLKVGGDPDTDILRIKAVAAEMQPGEVSEQAFWKTQASKCAK